MIRQWSTKFLKKFSEINFVGVCILGTNEKARRSYLFSVELFWAVVNANNYLMIIDTINYVLGMCCMFYKIF
jgi:hypothetical protein